MNKELKILLKNQMIVNEYDQSMNETFKEMSLSMTKRVFNMLLSKDLFNFRACPLHTGLKYRANEHLLKAIVSIEAIQDLKSVHGIDAEEELACLVAQEIAMEIDRINLYAIKKIASIFPTWNYAGAEGDTVTEKCESLIKLLISMLSGAKNNKKWIITSPEVASILQTTSWIQNKELNAFEHSLGIQCIGLTRNGYSVYRDPLLPRDEILTGCAEDYVYSPLILATSKNTTVNNDSFVSRLGIKTKYISGFTNKSNFGRARVEGLDV